MRPDAIKVFLGSSCMLHTYRGAFVHLLRSLGEERLDTVGASIEPVMWETENYAIERAGSKQDMYNDRLRGCDLAFFLVREDIGDFTRIEYTAALEALDRCGKPAVRLWVQDHDLPRARTARLEEFIEDAARDERVVLAHYASKDDLMADMARAVVETCGDVGVRVAHGRLMAGHMCLADVDGLSEDRAGALREWAEGA